MTENRFTPSPATRRVLIDALKTYPCGLTMSELRRRTTAGRSGLIVAAADTAEGAER